MLKNYLTIALRNLRKRRAYSFINVAGLAIGMACSMLIFLSVRHDLSFDRFHAKADRIYRVLTIDRALGVSSQRVGITLPALGPAMEAELPEVERVVRLNTAGRSLVSYEDTDLYAENVVYAEAALFEIFDFGVRSGDAGGLREPGTVVLTEALARRIFGEADPVGRTVTLDDDAELRVVAVAEDVPANSHLVFDAVVSYVPSKDQPQLEQFLSSWGSISMTTYALLRSPEDAAGLPEKLEAIIRRNDVGENFSVTVQPLADVHLRSSDILFDESSGKSDVEYVYGLSAVAVFVLLIAAMNFMNLATARSAERAREVGMRKVLGAERRQLVGQFLGESVLLCALAFVLAVGLVKAALPLVNTALGKSLALDLLSEPVLVLYLAGLALGVALLAGSYPAFVLSGFSPLVVLKGTFSRGRRGALLRRALVVTQFAASAVMIIGALVVAEQLRYIMEKQMGYDRDQVVVLSLGGPALQEKAATLRDELVRQPGVVAAATSGSVPGRQLGRTGVQPEGAAEDDVWIMSVFGIDDRFVPLMDIELAAGRNYGREHGTDQQEAILINEAAARALGWQDPVGKHLTLGQQQRTVVGVVKDFHFASVRHQIEPLMMLYVPEGAPLLSLKLDAQQIPAALASIEAAWKRLYPDHPFEYSFLDSEFAEQYREEANFAVLARGFTLLSIFVACLGLFGLASFTAEQRTKEIGVRKVMGASVPGLVLLLSKEFTRLVVVALVVAAPVAYFVMHHWLEDFAYRIDLSPWIFAVAGALALAIAWVTVSYQAVRAALTDPVKALRYE